MNDVIIRRARCDDAAQLLAYLRRIGAETDNLSFGAEGLPLSVEQEADYIKNLETGSGSVMFVAEYNGTIIGDGSLNVLPRRMSHRAELGLCVVREHWGRGIGSMLMDALICHAKETGLDMVSLEVRTDNHRSIALYKKFGFQKVCTYPNYMKINGSGVSVDLMYLAL